MRKVLTLLASLVAILATPSNAAAQTQTVCPFEQLAKRHRELICRANPAFIQGLLQGRQHNGLRAVLDPRPQRCCVALV